VDRLEAQAGVQVVEGRVTVSATSAPLSSLLREIARQSGLSIMVLGQADQTITIAFKDLSLDEALRILSRGNGGGALVYEEGPGTARRLVGAYLTLAPGGPGLRDPVTTAAPRSAEARVVERPGITDGPVLPPTVAAAEEQLRTGAPEDFITAAIALYPNVNKPVEAVYAAATEHPDPSVRMNALSVMAEVGSGEQAQRILEQAANDPDPTVQALARGMLGIQDSRQPMSPVRPTGKPRR
jgi:hypothetical protein